MLTNRNALRKLALEVSAQRRNGKFTRVSAGFLAEIEGQVARIVTRKVREHPSRGKTLMAEFDED